MSLNTIYALATPYGKSGVAIIRISGDRVLEVARKLGINKQLIHKQARYTSLQYNGMIIDYALVIYFKAPHSYTGEESLELHIHGSRAVINSMLSVLADIEFIEMAQPGEFTKRAFINGKMDLAQVEGLADLIEAETSKQQQQALKQMSGHISKLYDSFREKIIFALSMLEAFIDFPDEDIPTEIIEEISNMVAELKSELNKHISDNNRGEKLRSGIKVAITGKPNVGKSSLINLLAKREVAIVSDIPGTTRDVIEVYLDISGFPFIIFDTAGIREASDNIEGIGIAKAKEKIAEADVVLHMLDAAEFDEIDPIYIDNKQNIILLNKIDLVPAYVKTDNNIIAISIKENTGIDALILSLKTFAENNYGSDEDVYITRARHRENCCESLFNLNNFNLNKPVELAAEDLRLASFAIAKITGKIDVEELLDIIFGSFCIGK